LAVRDELVPISEAKVRLYELVRGLHARNVVLLRHSRPVAALVDFRAYVDLLEQIEDLKDRISVLEAEGEATDMRVPWEKVKVETDLVG
jgi:hypothetical protein